MKQNAYLARQRARMESEITGRNQMVLQMSCDAAVLAAAEVFGAGAVRAERFVKAFERVFMEIATMVANDSDKEIVYAKAKLDEALRQVLGDKLVPWDERYSRRERG